TTFSRDWSSDVCSSDLWLTVEEMDTYEAEYARTGFAGPLQWYRAMDVSWHARKEFERQTNPVPFYFLYSEHDPDLEGFHGRDPLDRKSVVKEKGRGDAR